MAKKIGNKATTSSQAAAREALRRGKNYLITAQEEALDSTDCPFARSNSLKHQLSNWVLGHRIKEKVNADGSKMTLKQELALREAHGYGTEKTLESIRAKLRGEGAEDKFAGLTDEEIMEALEAPADEEEAAA